VLDASHMDFVNKKEDYEKIKESILNGEYKEGMNPLIL